MVIDGLVEKAIDGPVEMGIDGLVEKVIDGFVGIGRDYTIRPCLLLLAGRCRLKAGFVVCPVLDWLVPSEDAAHYISPTALGTESALSCSSARPEGSLTETNSAAHTRSRCKVLEMWSWTHLCRRIPRASVGGALGLMHNAQECAAAGRRAVPRVSRSNLLFHEPRPTGLSFPLTRYHTGRRLRSRRSPHYTTRGPPTPTRTPGRTRGTSRCRATAASPRACPRAQTPPPPA